MADDPQDARCEQALPQEQASPEEQVRAESPRARSLLDGAVLFPNIYVWYVLLASMDIMLTCVILTDGGREINSIADRVIDNWGLPGLVIFKFALVVLVVCICEIVGRRNYKTGHKLAEWSVAVTAIPVVVSFVQILARIHTSTN